MDEREMSLDEYLASKLAVMPAHHRVQREYRELKAENERLKNANDRLREMLDLLGGDT